MVEIISSYELKTKYGYSSENADKKWAEDKEVNKWIKQFNRGAVECAKQSRKSIIMFISDFETDGDKRNYFLAKIIRNGYILVAVAHSDNYVTKKGNLGMGKQYVFIGEETKRNDMLKGVKVYVCVLDGQIMGCNSMSHAMDCYNANVDDCKEAYIIEAVAKRKIWKPDIEDTQWESEEIEE